MDKAIIEKAKSEHPGTPIYRLACEDYDTEIIVRAPTSTEWKRFRSMQQDDEQSPLALRALVLDCLIVPSREDFMLALEKRPGLAETFGRHVIKIGGVSAATIVEKL